MDRRTGKRGDGGFSLSDGTPGRKAPLSEEDGRRFAGSPAVPPPHPFLCSSPFLFLFRDFLDPPHPLSLSLFSSLSLRLFGAVLPYFFRWGDTTQLPEKTLRQFPTGEPISIIAGVLHLAGENPLLDRPLS